MLYLVGDKVTNVTVINHIYKCDYFWCYLDLCVYYVTYAGDCRQANALSHLALHRLNIVCEEAIHMSRQRGNVEERNAAVITGDIVKSQSLSDEDFSRIIQALKAQLTTYARLYDGHFDVFRGDAFQFVTSHSQSVMRIALGIRLALKAMTPSSDIRVSCAVGEVTFRPSEVKTGTGQAFVLSGRGLDELKGQYVSFQCEYGSLARHTSLLTRFADSHLAGLTQTQSETVLAYLVSEDKNHDAVATSLGKTRSNVTRILNASNYRLIAEYLAFMEQEISTVLSGTTI